MFEQSFTAGQPVRQGWSFAGSIVLQFAFLGGIILVPLLNTYEIDLGAWGLRAIHIAPPPPPAPPPAQPAPAPQAAPQLYEAEFRAPSAIPDRVATLNDIGSPVSPLAAMPAPSGPIGGAGDSSAAGVFGMFPTTGQHLALPPPIRIGGNIQNARVLHKPPPVYPPEAVEQYVSGKVQLEAIIGIEGGVRDLRLITGHPLLAPAAMDAVSQWRYRPTRLNGTVVEVVTIIEVTFNLTIIDEKEMKRRRRQERRERNAQ